MAENILKELCNRLLSLFRQTEAKEENAKEVACNRLRVVLMQDRTNLTPELLQRMRRELVELLSKYVEMDKEALELNFDQDGDQMALMLSIPVIRAKDEAEIEDALKSDEDAQEDDESEDNDEDEDSETDNSDEDAQEDEVEDEAEEEISEDETEKEDENLSEDENSDKE